MKLGKIQFSDGSLLTNVLDGYSGGSFVRYQTPIDEYTVINWKLNEESEPFLNHGNGGALSLTRYTGTLTTKCTGLFGHCIHSTGVLRTPYTTIGSLNNNFTASLWVKPTAHSAWGHFLNKNVSGDINHPYSFLFMQGDSQVSLAHYVRINNADIPANTSIPAYFMSLNQWSLLAMTYDGQNLKSYKDGTLEKQTSISGTIDYGNGRYCIMGISDGGQLSSGYIEDIRIESIARSEEYIKNMYLNGRLLY